MYWDQFAAQWEEQKCRVRKRWGLLTDNDLHEVDQLREIHAKWECLVAKIMAQYGLTIQTAERQILDFLCSIEPPDVQWEQGRLKAAHRG